MKKFSNHRPNSHPYHTSYPFPDPHSTKPPPLQIPVGHPCNFSCHPSPAQHPNTFSVALMALGHFYGNTLFRNKNKIREIKERDKQQHQQLKMTPPMHRNRETYQYSNRGL